MSFVFNSYFLHQVFASSDNVCYSTEQMAYLIAKRLQQSKGSSNEDDAKIAAIKIETRNESLAFPENPWKGN